MKRIALLVTAILVSTAAFAKEDRPDYSDTAKFNCDKDDIEISLRALKSNNTNPFEPKIIYVKTASELYRRDDGMACKISIKLTNGRVQSGYWVHTYEDGHALVGFKTSLRN